MPASNQIRQPLTRIKRNLLFILAVALSLSTNIVSEWSWQITSIENTLSTSHPHPNGAIEEKKIAQVITFGVHDSVPAGVGENTPLIGIRMLGGWGRGRFTCPAAIDHKEGKVYEVDNGDGWTQIELDPHHSDVINRRLHLSMADLEERTIIYNFMPSLKAPPVMDLYYVGNIIGKARHTVPQYALDTLLEVEVLESKTHASFVFNIPGDRTVTIAAGTKQFLNIDPRLLDKSDAIPIRLVQVLPK